MTEKATHVRTFTGKVISDKMEKTRVVAVSRQKKHPKYLKYYKVTTTFMAHDEANSTREGDTVTIQATRPMSKNKRWEIVPNTK
jgi:small subunit ribosomal protein S17